MTSDPPTPSPTPLSDEELETIRERAGCWPKNSLEAARLIATIDTQQAVVTRLRSALETLVNSLDRYTSTVGTTEMAIRSWGDVVDAMPAARAALARHKEGT